VGAALGTLALSTLAGLPAPAFGQSDEGVEIEDRLDVLRVDRRLIAVSGDDGRILEEKLRPDERVVSLESQGVVGVAATEHRLLGVTTRSSSWQEIQLRVHEKAPGRLHLGDRIVVVPLERRLLALTRGAGIWTELDLLAGEVPVRVEVEAEVAVCVTGRRAIGLSAQGGGFVEVPLTPREEVESISLEARSVTLRTLYRVLVFRAGAVRWAELRRTDFRGLSPE
jgi:hypothetical protein